MVRAASENSYVKEAAEARLSSGLMTWCGKAVKGLDFRAGLPEWESQPVATCWGNFLMSLCLNLLTAKMWVLIVPTSLSYMN